MVLSQILHDLHGLLISDSVKIRTSIVFLQPGRDGGSGVVCGLNVAVGVADTAFACVFGVICSLCGLFYTTLR